MVSRAFLPVLIALTLSVARPATSRSFSDEAWKANEDIYHAILEHPFLRGLTDGTLDRKAFTFYMIQDAHYLAEFAHALEVTAKKAPKQDWQALLESHAKATLEEERRLHQSVFEEYGVSLEEQEAFVPSPEAYGYTSHLIATAYRGSFAESMAALLPCYWIYWEVGKDLGRRGSPSPVYQKWIDAYSSEAYGESVRAVIAIVNDMADKATAEERARMMENFRRSSRYEWMFWDSAFHQNGWPPKSKEE